jgi:hypothetical protein
MVGTDGTVWIADAGRHQVLRLSPSGALSVVAGTGESGDSGDGNLATEARLKEPSGLASDGRGGLLIADRGSHRVRRVGPEGHIGPFAGTGKAGFSGDGGQAALAALRAPGPLLVDSQGVVWIADVGNGRVRRVALDGTITTVAGSGETRYTGNGGPADRALFTGLHSLVPRTDGSLLLVDDGDLRCLDANGTIRAYPWSLVGGTREVRLAATDGRGGLYAAGSRVDRIWHLNAEGEAVHVAGAGADTPGGDGGPALEASFKYVAGMAVDAQGRLCFTDRDAHVVRRIDADGTIRRIAGTGEAGYLGEGGPASAALLDTPTVLARDGDGGLIFWDGGNSRVRRIAPDGTLATVAGTGKGGRPYSGEGGPAAEATLPEVTALLAHPEGGFLLATSRRVLRVNREGTIDALVGTGKEGCTGDGGPAAEATLTRPTCLAWDAEGGLLIGDDGAGRIRRVAPDGTVSTLAGVADPLFTGDGGPALLASLPSIGGLALNGAGDLLVSDALHAVLREVSPAGIVSTLAWPSPGAAPSDTPTAPSGLALSPEGDLYVADPEGHCAWHRFPDGRLERCIGDGKAEDSGDGGPATQGRLLAPTALALGPDGSLLIADSEAGRVRKVVGSSTSAAPSGDVTGDAKVTISDALVLLRAVLGLVPTTPELLRSGDMNGNGRLDVQDAVAVLRLAAGLG